MHSHIAEAWTHALTSGEYEQCQDRLRRDDSFCCLGVLCDLYMQKHPFEARWHERGGEGWFFQHQASMACEEQLLPKIVMDWAGLKDPQGGVHYDIGTDDRASFTLAQLNDEGAPFQAIASVIKSMARAL